MAATPQPDEAHSPYTEYIVERALLGGGWVVESITPSPDAAHATGRLDRLAWVRPHDTFRIVSRHIVSTVEYIRPGTEEPLS